MKAKKRFTIPADGSLVLSGMKGKSGLGLCYAEVLLDQELKELARDWTINEAKGVASDLERWSKQLIAWAVARSGSGTRRVNRKKSTVKRGARKPFFGFMLMGFRDKGYRNMARCLGISHRQLFDHALMAWSKEAEEIIGLDICRASKLARRECDAIKRRVALALGASWKGGNSDSN